MEERSTQQTRERDTGEDGQWKTEKVHSRIEEKDDGLIGQEEGRVREQEYGQVYQDLFEERRAAGRVQEILRFRNGDIPSMSQARQQLHGQQFQPGAQQEIRIYTLFALLWEKKIKQRRQGQAKGGADEW